MKLDNFFVVFVRYFGGRRAQNLTKYKKRLRVIMQLANRNVVIT